MTSMGGRREDGFTILPPQLSVLPYYKFLDTKRTSYVLRSTVCYVVSMLNYRWRADSCTKKTSKTSMPPSVKSEHEVTSEASHRVGSFLPTDIKHIFCKISTPWPLVWSPPFYARVRWWWSKTLVMVEKSITVPLVSLCPLCPFEVKAKC